MCTSSGPSANRSERAAAHMWASGVSWLTPAARSLRFADGPDEVHKRSLARRELRRYLGQGAPQPAASQN